MLRWRLFAIASYILLVLYAVFLFFSIKFMIRMIERQQDQLKFLPYAIANFLIVLNTTWCVYLFHSHIPYRAMSKIKRNINMVLTFIFIGAWGYLLILMFSVIVEAIRDPNDLYYTVFMTGVYSLTAIGGGYIAINQLSISRAINKMGINKVDQMIDEIGNNKDTQE